MPHVARGCLAYHLALRLLAAQDVAPAHHDGGELNAAPTTLAGRAMLNVVMLMPLLPPARRAPPESFRMTRSDSAHAFSVRCSSIWNHLS